MQILRVLTGTVTRLDNIWWTIIKRVKVNLQHQRLSTIYMEKSVKTIYERNDPCYVGLPGAATLDLSKKARKKVLCLEDSEDEEDDMSKISNLSRKALIDLILKKKKKKMGSYTKNNHNK